MKKLLLLFGIFLTAFFIGCNDNSGIDETIKTQEKNVWKTGAETFEDGWSMTTKTPDNEYGTYLGNGYLGIRLFSQGTSLKNEKPEPMYMAGVYGDENLISVPNIADLRFYEYNNSQVTEFAIDNKNYEQTLDMKAGILSTSCVLKANGKKLKCRLDTYVLRLNDKSSKVYIKAFIESDYKGQLLVVAPVVYDKSIYSYDKNQKAYLLKLKSKTKKLFVKQNIIPEDIVREDQRVNMGATVLGDYDEACQFLCSVDKKSEFRLSYIAEISKEPIKTSIDNIDAIYPLQQEHDANWEKLWESDVMIEGDNEAQQVVRSNLFYLLCSASPDYSIAPMGLSMNAFSGHVFWDSELWMFPALIWQHPDLAKGILKYRIKTLEGAKANAAKNGMKGAEYAWESGESGIETSPDPSTVHERHINGDIAFAIWQYYVFTDDKEFLKEAYPVLTATADYWLSRAVKGESGKYEIKQVCPPDENANIVDNSVYTNAIAQINLWIATEAGKVLGISPNPEYMNMANNMFIGVDKENNRFNIYDGYKGGKIKQADPELLSYPLKYNEFITKLSGDYSFGNDLFENTFKFYKDKVTENGPAMSNSAHAVVSARMKDEKAIEDFYGSYRPFMRGPFNYFNEKRSHTYVYWCFLTGAGSSFASVPWGFCGLDVDLYDNYENADFKYSNNLPKEWTKVILKGVKFKGKKYDLIYEDGKVIKDLVL